MFILSHVTLTFRRECKNHDCTRIRITIGKRIAVRICCRIECAYPNGNGRGIIIFFMFETPGAFQEAKNRIREIEEQQRRKSQEAMTDWFIAKEAHLTTERYGISQLKNRIRTTSSLSSLKEDLKMALQLGEISREAYDTYLRDIEDAEDGEVIATKDFPFGMQQFVQDMEKSPL
jgi:hypothetical protein